MTATKKHKKNLIVSYKNLTEDLKEKLKVAYPDGYNDYLQRFTKPNGETIFVVPFETEDTCYMVKFEVVIDTLGEDLDKALFDDDDDSGKEDEFAPLSEALEKEESDPTHKERVLRHGDFETNLEDDEKRKKKLTLGINKEEIRAAFGDDDDVEELDSYEKIGDDDDEPSDEDLSPRTRTSVASRKNTSTPRTRPLMPPFPRMKRPSPNPRSAAVRRKPNRNK